MPPQWRFWHLCNMPIFLQQAMGDLSATQLSAMSNTSYLLPVFRDLLIIRRWSFVQLKGTGKCPWKESLSWQSIRKTWLQQDKTWRLVQIRGDTIPGNRSCYPFVPTSQYTIEGKQLSIDKTVFINHSFLDMPAPQNNSWVA